MQLTEKQTEILEANGPLLVTGGPGSGKTTISILKAARIAEHELRPEQKILFLSFARATVSRVVEAIENEQQIPRDQKKRIVVETYHSFFWRILRAHGYLVGLPRRVTVLPPAAEAIALSTIRSAYGPDSQLSDAQKREKSLSEAAERERLAGQEGYICFERFAPYVGDILAGSERISRLIATAYPVVILDEFQDTNAEQWRVVSRLGKYTTAIALADSEQRIYDWLGADPERLKHFKEAFAPTTIDLRGDNHRSPGTEIAEFGNDLLTGRFRQREYSGIDLLGYETNGAQAWSSLVTTTYTVRRRLAKSGRDWSLAVLVPTKKMTRLVSDAFRSPPAGMTEIRHTAVVEMEAAILGAEIIALLMQPAVDDGHLEQFIELLRNYFHGKGGDKPTQSDLKEASRVVRAYDDWIDRRTTGKTMRGNSILVDILAVYDSTHALQLGGDPDKDWLAVRDVLEEGACVRLKGVAKEVRNIRLLERGTQLRQALSADWRNNGTYANALKITRQAFVQEHFSMSAKPESGVVVMNMHKAKGKQFDEVIIFEGWPKRVRRKIVANPDRIVWGNARQNCTSQARQNLRVSVTRGKRRTTILTPKDDPCILLP